MTPEVEGLLVEDLDRQKACDSTPEFVRTFAEVLASVVDPVQLRLF